ncbi:hypothetical protein TNCV_1346401 [Trichonephila clavipes]|nr:hypothetical protein TNCV_1346401 [Trichonephila clavipes]
MATPSSSFTPTPFGHEDNLEILREKNAASVIRRPEYHEVEVCLGSMRISIILEKSSGLHALDGPVRSMHSRRTSLTPPKNTPLPR